MSSPQPLILTGPPRRIQLMNHELASTQVSQLTTLEALGPFAKNEAIPLRVRQRANQLADVKIRLPLDTPPGQYQAQLYLDGSQHEAIIQVEAAPKMRILPKGLSLQAAPDEKISIPLTLENTGNTQLEIPKTLVGNAFSWQVVPSALAHTLQSDAETMPLIEKLLYELKDGYGGVFKCKLIGRTSQLKTRQRAQYRLETRVPAEAQPGYQYMVILHIERFHFIFELTVK